MNATEKAKILKANGWKLNKRKPSEAHFTFCWYTPADIRYGASDSFAAATHMAYDYLEAQVTQAANDLAGQEAYNEVQRSYEEAISFEEIEFAIYPDKAENAQLRAENAALKVGILEALNLLKPLQSWTSSADDAIATLEDALFVAETPAPLAQAEASEVTLETEELDWLAKRRQFGNLYEFWDTAKFYQGFQGRFLIGAELDEYPKGYGYTSFYKLRPEFDTAANRAAIAARRKELGLEAKS